MIRTLLLFAATLMFTLTPVSVHAADAFSVAQVNLHDGTAAGDTWTQSFATTPGQAYQLYFGLAQSLPVPGQTVKVIITAGNNNPVSTEFNAPASSTTPHTATFVATGPTTTLTLVDEASSTSSSITNITSLSVATLPPYDHPGHYQGVVVEGRNFRGNPETETITSSEARRANVRINSAGQIFFILEPGDEYSVGTIHNDGLATYGDTDSTHGSAVFKNGILRISYSFTNHVGGNFNGVAMVRTRLFTLRRVGN